MGEDVRLKISLYIHQPFINVKFGVLTGELIKKVINTIMSYSLIVR
jgi:hypothetical protein